MVFVDRAATVRMVQSLGKRCGQIFMDGAETEKLTAGFYFGYQVTAGASNFFNRYFALLYVLNGEGRLIDHDGVRHQLVPGTLMIRHPGKTHSLERLSGNDWLEFACAVPTSFYLALNKAGIVDGNCYCLNPGLSPELIAMAREYVACFDGPGGVGEVYCHFIRLFGALVDASRSAPDSRGKVRESDRMEQAKKLLREEPERNGSLAALAAKLGMGYENFRKVFKAEVGVSPHHYRILHSLDKAEVLLRQTDMRIKEIALELGYGDVADFTRQYRKFRQMSPTQYRRARNGT